ncbi:MAG: twin-arginine translocase subunit TatC [Bacteroidaceae bacterium]|nr:twin-arginine translocase subunit TatC [Bacteroidaceae bacterium]
MEEEQSMSFWDHLEALRWALMRVAIVMVILLVGLFSYMPLIFDKFILAPTTSNFFLYRWLSGLGELGPFFPNFGNDNFAVEIININVASQFLTHITTSFWFAFILSFPYLIYELWKFIKPALYKNEEKYIGFAFLFGTAMFYIGCTLGYSLVFPFTFRFLTEYQLSEAITNQISLSSYMGNFMMMILVMGIVFELPLLVWILSGLGVVNKAFLKKFRRHAVVVLLILAAIITPSGDPFTLMTVFLPLFMLYEFGIMLARK